MPGCVQNRHFGERQSESRAYDRYISFQSLVSANKIGEKASTIVTNPNNLGLEV